MLTGTLNFTLDLNLIFSIAGFAIGLAGCLRPRKNDV